MKIERAPRSKKRVFCDLAIDGNRYKGIVLDVSASGLFVQTNVKPAAGTPLQVTLTIPGLQETVVLDARVVRKKAVPAALLTSAGGGIGLAIDKAPKAYLDFIARLSPAQAEYVATATEASKASASRGRTVGSGSSNGASSATVRAAVTRFRIHVVEASTGLKNSYLVSCDREGEASAEVLEQLGPEWQVLFVERV